jgi:hypothetical protein
MAGGALSTAGEAADDLRSGRLVAQRGIGTHAIVMLAPPFDDDLYLLERREYLAVEQLIAQSPLKLGTTTILPTLISDTTEKCKRPSTRFAGLPEIPASPACIWRDRFRRRGGPVCMIRQ